MVKGKDVKWPLILTYLAIDIILAAYVYVTTLNSEINDWCQPYPLLWAQANAFITIMVAFNFYFDDKKKQRATEYYGDALITKIFNSELKTFNENKSKFEEKRDEI